MTAPHKFKIWVATDIGRHRRVHADAVAAPGLSEVRPEAWASFVNEGNWIFIADGIGGNPAGDVASELAVTMLSGIMHRLQTETEISAGLAAVHSEIILSGEQNAQFSGMGTTIAGVFLKRGKCLALNLGDSRIYHLGGEGMRQITVDHSGEDGLFGYLGGSHPVLARKPDFHEVGSGPGEIIMMCTDGLTNMLSDQHIEAVLSQEEENPARALVDAALEAGGYDNVAVIVIRLEPDV